MVSLNVYPFGVVEFEDEKVRYLKAIYSCNYLAIKPDKEITDLYSLSKSNQLYFEDFDFIEELIRQCKKKFGYSFKTWLDFQAQLARAGNGYNIDYLTDTYDFISGANRSIEQHGWEPLLEYTKYERTKSIDYHDSGVTTDYIAKWICRPNGVNDMLKTIYQIFGK